MSVNWPLVRLGDIVNFKTGRLDSNAAVANGRYPFFTCSPQTYCIDEYAFDDEAVILAGNNANGVFCVKYYKGKFNAYQRTYVVTPKDEKVINTRWLYFMICFVTKRLGEMSVGSATKFLTKKILDAFEISLPDVKEQSRQANVLWALEDSIALNTQLNQLLEEAAQAIFKSWFVDFDPVKAKMATLEAGGTVEDAVHAAMRSISGKADDELQAFYNESPEDYAELKATAELFPSTMQESELGMIPEGWECVLSGDVVDVRDGTHDSPKKSATGYPLVTSKHITSGELKLSEAYLISEADYNKVNKRSAVSTGDILLTMIGTVGVPYYVAVKQVDFAIKNIGLFRTSESSLYKYYLYFLLKSRHMQNYLNARMAGTTQKYLSLKVLRSIKFVSSTDSLLLMFSRRINSYMELIQCNREAVESLQNLRDTLLPKLLSGEITIPEAEEAVEAAQ